MQADLLNGQFFEGTTLAYFPNSTTRFEIAFDGDVVPVEARMGDSPALAMTAPDRDGLLVVAHEAAASTLTYKEWDKFLAFADHKDFPDAAADHEAGGFSKEKFTERYTRHSKALIAVGSGAGADREMGLATEVTALTNPYVPEFDGQMRVSLTYDGAPRPDAQVEVYERDAALAVTVSITRTDDAGVAVFATKPGHDYLVDAVVLRPAPDAGETENSPVWETLWASLTFHVPQ